MALLQGIGKQPEGSLPRAVQQVQRSVHPLPVGQVVECIADKTLKKYPLHIFILFNDILVKYGIYLMASLSPLLRICSGGRINGFISSKY
jgi:hypothetical protein